MLAWHPVPFKIDGREMKERLNSPAFIIHVLSLGNLTAEKRNGQRDSAALRSATDEVHGAPLPRDLMFFQGTESGSTANT